MAAFHFSDPVVRFMGAEGRLFDLTHTYLQVTWYLFAVVTAKERGSRGTEALKR